MKIDLERHDYFQYKQIDIERKLNIIVRASTGFEYWYFVNSVLETYSLLIDDAVKYKYWSTVKDYDEL